MDPALDLFILAGGRSTRFGSEDKARAEVHGVPLLVHVAGQLAAAVGRTTVIAAQDGAYDDLGLSTLGDLVPGEGPLGGLVTAAAHSATEWFLLTSCDLVRPRPEWVEVLCAQVSPGARAVAFRHERWEPLFALYHRSVGEVAAERLERGERAMWRLLDAVGATAVAVPEDWASMRAVNTKEALDEALGS